MRSLVVNFVAVFSSVVFVSCDQINLDGSNINTFTRILQEFYQVLLNFVNESGNYFIRKFLLKVSDGGGGVTTYLH